MGRLMSSGVTCTIFLPAPSAPFISFHTNCTLLALQLPPAALLLAY